MIFRVMQLILSKTVRAFPVIVAGQPASDRPSDIPNEAGPGAWSS